MIEITAEVLLDARSKLGRVLEIRITTNDEFVNNTLPTPFILRKTFVKGTTQKAIRQNLKSEIEGIVISVKNKIKDEGLVGRKLVFTV